MALSKLIKESRPRAAGCGDAKQNRRRDATSNTTALDVASQPAVIQSQQAPNQALQGKHNNSKQQNKRNKAKNIATAAYSPEAPLQHPSANMPTSTQQVARHCFRSRAIRALNKFQMCRVCRGGLCCVVRLLRMKRRDSPPGRAQTDGHDDPTFVTSAP